jgi:hypothetical protein
LLAGLEWFAGALLPPQPVFSQAFPHQKFKAESGEGRLRGNGLRVPPWISGGAGRIAVGFAETQRQYFWDLAIDLQRPVPTIRPLRPTGSRNPVSDRARSRRRKRWSAFFGLARFRKVFGPQIRRVLRDRWGREALVGGGVD